MFRWIVATSLQYRFLVVFVAAVLMAYGITRVGAMPLDVFPEFAPPMVEIQTEGPGMSALEAEEFITIPLEQALNGTPGLAVLRSKTVQGLSQIKLIFKPGTDLLRARQLVNERVATAVHSLPQTAGFVFMLAPLSATSRAMKVGITSKTMDMMELSTIAWWNLRFDLLRVPGVANVVFWGDRRKQFQVQIDPERLRAYNVSLDQVLELTQGSLELGMLQYAPSGKMRTGGFLDTPNNRLGIQHVLPVIEPEHMAQVSVYGRKKPDGTPLTVGDLGRVVWDTWPMIGDGVINDGQGLLMIVEKLPWGNTLDVTRGVEEAIAKLKPGLPGVDFDTTIFRPASYVELSINNLLHSLWLGAALVMLVLLGFLFEWRLAMISATIIPVSLMATLLVVDARGNTINVMILAGLAVSIGAVVDDAIVDVENIVRRVRVGRPAGSNKPTWNI